MGRWNRHRNRPDIVDVRSVERHIQSVVGRWRPRGLAHGYTLVPRVEVTFFDGAEPPDLAILDLRLRTKVPAYELTALPIYIHGRRMALGAADYLAMRARSLPVVPVDAVSLGWASEEVWEIALQLADDAAEEGSVDRTDFLDMAQALASAT